MSRKISLFVWMTDDELAACARRCNIDTNLPRRSQIKLLERKGWWRADITDLEHVRLQRRPE